jgi:hypothetical protein
MTTLGTAARTPWGSKSNIKTHRRPKAGRRNWRLEEVSTNEGGRRKWSVGWLSTEGGWRIWRLDDRSTTSSLGRNEKFVCSSIGWKNRIMLLCYRCLLRLAVCWQESYRRTI